MRPRITTFLSALLVGIAGCPSEVSVRDNAFDPDSIAPARGSIAGAVLAVGRPATGDRAENEDILVRLLQGDLEVAQVVTVADGSFGFADVEPANYRLTVEEPGYSTYIIPFLTMTIDGAFDLGTIELLPTSQTGDASILKGRAELTGADAHGGILVRLVGWPFDTQTGPDGSFQMTVSDGLYDVEFSYPDFQTFIIPDVSIGVAQVVDLEVVGGGPVSLLSDPATISGMVEIETCAADPTQSQILPADGATIALENPALAGTTVPSQYTGTALADGSFGVGNLPAGVYALRATLTGYDAEDVRGIAVRGGQSFTLTDTIRMPASRGALDGRVQLTGEADHSGVLVQVNGTQFFTLTAADGRFRIDGVCAGTSYEVIASKDKFVTISSAGISVASGQTTTVPTMNMERQQGGLTLNGGSDFTSVVDVAYQLDAPAGTTHMRISEDQTLFAGGNSVGDPEAGTGSWFAYAATGTFTLQTVDGVTLFEGTRDVYAQVYGAGAFSGQLTDDVILDQTAPANPGLVIETGTGYSNDGDGAVLITLTASEVPIGGVDRVSGLSRVRLLNTDTQNPLCATTPCVTPTQTDWDTTIDQPYNLVIDHPLRDPAIDELKEVWVRFSDRAGNWSAPVFTQVIMDREAPDGIGIDIQGGAPFARSDRVRLDLLAADENPGLQMRLSNESTFLGSLWQPFSPSVTWFLDGSTDGLKQVWVQYMDVAGNQSQALDDTITLDRALPVAVSFSVDQGAYTNVLALDLTLAFSDATGMVVADNPSFLDSGGSALPFVPASTVGTFTLTATETMHTLYVQFRDDADNRSQVLTATVTYDQTPPAAPSVALAEGVIDGATGRVHLATTTVTLLTTAIPGPLDANEMKVDVAELDSGGVETGRTTGAWEAFSPGKPLTLPIVAPLPPPAQFKRIELSLRDAAGNVTAATADIEVMYDPDAPVITSAQLDGGATHTASLQVTVTIVEDVATAGDANQMQVSNRADYAGAIWQPFAASFEWTLPATDLLHTVYVRVRDIARNETATSAQITLDRTAPGALDVELDGGNAYSTDLEVDIVLSAADASAGMNEVILSNDPGFTTSETIAWPGPPDDPTVTRLAWTLSAVDGLQTVYARFVDDVGNTIDAAGTIIIDRAPPVGTVTIDTGAAYATVVGVTLSLTAPPDTAQVSMANGPIADCASPPNAYEVWAATKAFTLTGADGTKTVTVCFRDAAGLTTQSSDTIVLDTQNPAGTLVIDTGATWTNGLSVDLALTAPADTVQMALVNAATLNCSAASYEAYSALRKWSLASGNGQRFVTVCFKDAAGRTATATDDIELDTSPPAGTIELAGGATYTTVATVTVALVVPNDVDGYALGDGLVDCATASYTAVAVGTTNIPTTHVLPAGDGTRTVAVCFRDEAGNTASASDTVILDTLSPTGTVFINGPDLYTTAVGVTLALTASVDAVDVSAVNGAVLNCATATYQAFTTSLGLTLTGLDGTNTVTVCFRDAAGLTGSASDTIELDRVAPTGTVLIDGDAATANTTSVILDLTADADVILMAVGDGAIDCATANYEAYATPRGWSLPSGNGGKTVGVCFKDGSGRTGSDSDTITLDETAPIGTISLAGGSNYATSTTVSVDLTFPNDTDGYALGDGTLDCATASYTAVTVGDTARSTTRLVPAGDGTKMVTVCFRDTAQNTASVSDTVVLDTQTPDGTVTIDNDAFWTTTISVVLNFAAATDTNEMSIVNGVVIDCATATYQAYSSSLAWTLAGGEGDNRVTVCFRDPAGLTFETTDTIELDTINPTGTVSIDATAAYATSRAVTITLTAAIDVISMSLVNAATLNCSTATYEAFATTVTWTLPNSQGTNSVTACFKDGSGRTGTVTDDIELDTVVPGGTITLDGGATYATGLDVVANLTFPNDTDGYSLADGVLDCAGATYTALVVGTIVLAPAYTLPPGDGGKTVVACFRDVAGNTATAADTIVLDTEIPVGTAAIEGGDEFALSATVTVDLVAPADTNEMSVVEAATLDCAAAIYESFVATKVLVLGGEGVRTVRVCFRDFAGLTFGTGDTIIVDTLDPTGTLVIDAAESHSQSRNVTLSVTAAPDVVAMAFLDGGAINCSTATYEPYSATRAWTLPATEGLRDVIGCLKDAADRTGTINDSIILDTLAPSAATMVIDGAAAYAVTESVTLTLTTPETVTVALANEVLDCASATYVAFAASVPWTLQASDGVRTVVTCFKDAAGWIVSQTDDIVLDRVAPDGGIVIDGGAVYTTDDLVDLAFSPPADTMLMAVSNATINCSIVAYGPFSPTQSSWDLDPADLIPANDGPKTVHACFQDAAGNISSEALATVVLDRVNPSASLVVAGGNNFVSDRSVTIEIVTTDTDLTGVAIAEGALACASAVYSAFTANFTYQMSDLDENKTIVVCIKDAAGRTAQLSDTITLDRDPPTGTLTVDGGAVWSTGRPVQIDGTSANGDWYSLANEAVDCLSLPASAWTAFTGSFQRACPGSCWVLSAQDGLRTVKACLRDDAGNIAVIEDDIVLDREDPVMTTFVIDGGASMTSDADVSLTIGATDNLALADMHISRDTVDGVWEAYSTSKAWDLNGGNPNVSEWRIVFIRFRDAAGNVSDWTIGTIGVDYHDPAVSSISILGGANYTATTGVSVAVGVTDMFFGFSNVTEMILSEDSGFSGGVWSPYVTPRAFTLSSNNGLKQIYVKVRDASERESGSLSDTITLDTVPPTVQSFTVTIPASGFTNVLGVQVEVVGVDNLSVGTDLEASFVEGVPASCTGAVYTDDFGGCATSPCTMLKGLTLTAGDGIRTVSTCLRDATGNTMIAPVSATVHVDTAPPPQVTGLTLIPASREILVSWGAVVEVGPNDSGVDHYEIEHDIGFGFGGAVASVTPDAATTSTVLDGLDNRKRYYVRVRAVDRAGNPGPWASFESSVTGVRTTIYTGVMDREGRAPIFRSDGAHLFAAFRQNFGGAPDHALMIAECDAGVMDCGGVGEWNVMTRFSGKEITSERQALAMGPKTVVAASIEKEDGSGFYSPVAWVCQRAGGCDTAGQFARVQLNSGGSCPAVSSDINPGFITAASSGTRTYLAYYRRDTGQAGWPQFLEIASCPHNSRCDVCDDWSRAWLSANIGTFPERRARTIIGGAPSLAAKGDYVYVAYNRYSSPDELWVYRCFAGNLCSSAAQWGAPFAILPTNDGSGSYRNALLAMTDDYLFAGWTKSTGPFPTNMVLGFSYCPLSSFCNSSTDWIVGPTSLASAFPWGDFGTGYPALDINVRDDRLMVSWWSTAAGSVNYLECNDADATACATSSDWSKITLDPFVLKDTVPSVVGYGANTAVIWMDDLNRLRGSMPMLPSPVGSGVAPTNGGVRSTWTVLPTVSGYEQVYDFDGGPLWDNAAIIGDPLIAQNDVPLSSGTYYEFALRSYDAQGRISDDSFETAAQPLTTGPTKSSVLHSGNCPTSGNYCAWYSGDGAGGLVAYAYSNNATSDGTVWYCDTGASSCTLGADWTTVIVITTSALRSDIKVVGDTIYAAWINNGPDQGWVTWCDTSSIDCSVTGNWSSYEFADGVTFQSDTVSMDVGAGRIWLAMNRGAGVNALDVWNCLLGSDCTADGNWRKVQVTASASTYKPSLDAGSNNVGIVRATPTSIVYYNCSTSSLCDAPSDFRTRVIDLPGVAPDPLTPPTIDVHDSTNQVMIAGVWEDELKVAICPYHSVYCDNGSNRWMIHSFGAMDATFGHTTQVETWGKYRYVMYADLQTLYLKTCSGRCWDPARWRSSSMLRNAELSEPAQNQDAFWVDDVTGEIGLGRATHGSSSYSTIAPFWGGLSQPQD